MALPASHIPSGFPEDLVFRTMAAYATLRTLSVPLRLSPFTPTAFVRALYLPYPNRLLGSVHVHILRILLHNLQMGYHWKDNSSSSSSSSLPLSFDIVKKRKIDHIKWPLRAGDNLRYLDWHTWPIFYDDYCHLTADIMYASLHDILDHIDLRSLNLHGITDRFSADRTEQQVAKDAPDHQYRDHNHHSDKFEIVEVDDSDEEYKQDENDEDDDSLHYDDDESYGPSKKKKAKGNATKTTRRKSIPKGWTTNGDSHIQSSVTVHSTSHAPQQPLHQQQVLPTKRSQSFPPPKPAVGLDTTNPPHTALYFNHQHYPSYQHPASMYPSLQGGEHALVYAKKPYMHQKGVIDDKMPTYQKDPEQQQQVERTWDQRMERRQDLVPNPLLKFLQEQESSIRRTKSHDVTTSHTPAATSGSSTLVERPSNDHVAFSVVQDVDSFGKQIDVIVLDSPVTANEGNDRGHAPNNKRTRDNDGDPRLLAVHHNMSHYELAHHPMYPAQPPIYYDRPNYHQYPQYLAPPPYQHRDFNTKPSGHIHPTLHLQNNCCPPLMNRVESQRYPAPPPYQPRDFNTKSSGYIRPTLPLPDDVCPPPVKRVDSMLGTDDDDDDTSVVVPTKSVARAPVQLTEKAISLTDHRNVSMSTDATVHSVSNTTSGGNDDISEAVVPVKAVVRAPLQPTETAMVHTKQKNVSLSNEAVAPSVSIDASVGVNDRAAGVPKTIALNVDDHGTDVNCTSKSSGETQVSEPSTIPVNSATLHRSNSPLAIAQVNNGKTTKASLQSNSTSNKSCTEAGRLQAFIRGQRKQNDVARTEISENETASSENICDAVSFPIDEPANWSHFNPLKTMRMGTPYHTLSVNDKLTILEFLIDELLSVGWVADEFTTRHESNAQHAYPYGPKPSDVEMQAFKDADGEQHDELCKVCNEIGDVVCCDGCVAVYHLECAGFLKSSRLPDIWYCPECAVKDPSSLGPLRSMKKSEVDWFTFADVGAADGYIRSLPPDGPIERPDKRDPKYLVVHGFVFCQNEGTDLNGAKGISSLQPIWQEVLAPKKLKDILKSFGREMYSKWPIEQIPTIPFALWGNSEGQLSNVYFKTKDYFDPTLYVNKYWRAPILLEGIRRSKESFGYEETILNDASIASITTGLLPCDVSNDCAIAASMRLDPKKYDALQVVKSSLLKIEHDLSKAFLLDEFWAAKQMLTTSPSWKEAVKNCTTVHCLSRLLLRLVDAAHHRAFIESWTSSLTAKCKESMPARKAEDCDSDLSPCEESLRRYWAHSRLCHLPTLLLKTSKHMIEVGKCSRQAIVANHSKRKDLESSPSRRLQNIPPTIGFGNVERKAHSRPDNESGGTKVTSLTLKVDDRLEGYIRRRMDKFLRESKLLVHRDLHWPVAGKKLFDPIGYLPAPSVRYLGRNGGAVFAPFVDYMTPHEVGQVAYCHVWRKQISRCTQFEHFTELVRILWTHLNHPMISKCSSFANMGKPLKGNSSVVVHRSQRDLLTGIDYFLLGNKARKWESSTEIDIGVFVRERVRRSKLHVDVISERILSESRLKAARKAQNVGTGPNQQSAAMLATNIIAAHIEGTKILLRKHGNGLSTAHLISLRTKTDYDLSLIRAGSLPYVNENGRIEMIMKAENVARESTNPASLPKLKPPGETLVLGANPTLQAARHKETKAKSVAGPSVTAIDLDEIMKTGFPIDWSRQVLQHHKAFTRSVYTKKGTATEFDLEESRRQCISNLNRLCKTAGVKTAYTQISGVIKQAENEVKEEFLASAKNSCEFGGGQNVSLSSQPHLQTVCGQRNSSSVPLMESGAANGSDSTSTHAGQSQNLVPSCIPTPTANATGVSNIPYWLNPHASMNVNHPSAQALQMTNNSAAASMAASYSSQIQQSPFLQQYNVNLGGNNVAYMSQPLQQQWLSPQQQFAVPFPAIQQGQPQQLSYSMGTPWSSTMPSSLQAQQQQLQYYPQAQQQLPQQQQMHQQQNGATKSNNWSS